MFYDNMLKLYKKAPSVGKIFRNTFFVLKNLWDVDKAFLCFLVFRTCFYSINAIADSFILKKIIEAIEQDEGFETVLHYGLFLVLLLAAGQVVSYISTLYNDTTSVKYTVHMNRFIYDRLSACELEDYENPEWNDRLNNALSINADAFSVVSAFAQMISSVISTAAVAIILLSYKWYLCLLVVAVAVLTAAVSSANKKLQYNYQLDSSKDRRKASYYPGVLFNGAFAKERKLYGYSEWLIEKYRNANGKIIEKLGALCAEMGKNYLITGFLANALRVATVLLVAHDAVHDCISIAQFSLYVSLFSTLSSNTDRLLSSCVWMQEKSLYIDYLLGFLNDISGKKTFAGKDHIERRQVNTIEFRGVSYRYPSEREYTLKNINFTFRDDEKICLVGVNGAGKTTLIKLLLGLYAPIEGKILFNNKDIAELDIAEYRKLFSGCFQDYCRYSLTVGENLVFSDVTEKNAEKIADSLEKVGLYGKISGFEKGINTPLTRYYDDSGKELSGGEWQKLALARAFLRGASFLVLDEPSSNLDAEAENKIFELIDKNVNSGVLFVSHRLSSAKSSDKIIVLTNGTISEHGTHTELINKKGEYYRLFILQSERY